MGRKRNKANDYGYQVDEMLESVWFLDHGPAKIVVLEEAVRIADAHSDDDRGFQARLKLIDAATFGGAPDVAMVAFAWCLARTDAEPERFDVSGLLWKYKWILDSAPDYPTIGRSQITDMLADMEKRYRLAGSGMHPVHQIARELYRVMGDLKSAKASHAKVLKSDRVPLSNCPACEQHAQMKFSFDIGQTDQAFKQAAPLVNGQMSCSEVPHVTYSYLLLPTLFAAEPELAAEYHNKGSRMLGTNPKFVSEVSRHLVYLTVVDDLPAAAKYLQKHFANGIATTCPAWRFEFDRAAAFLFDRLSEHPKPPRVRLPANLVLPAEVNAKDPASLRDFFTARARELADAFDTRNGNDRFTRRLAELAELKKQIIPSEN